MYSSTLTDGLRQELTEIRNQVCAQIARFETGSAEREVWVRRLDVVDGLLALEARTLRIAAVIRRPKKKAA